MEKNYYDILQVNRNASPEIIEKAYKVLAKKYHPDLQEEAHKKEAEDILKEINEAYEVLSNPKKKQDYDNLLKREDDFENQKKYNQQNTPDSDEIHQTSYSSNISKEDLLRRQQNQDQKRQQYNKQQEILQREQELIYQEQLQRAKQKAYHDAYIQDLKNRGYKIRYKKSFKDYINGLISLIITIIILFLLYQLPFVKQYFKTLYMENGLFKVFIDFIASIFKI